MKSLHEIFKRGAHLISKKINSKNFENSLPKDIALIILNLTPNDTCIDVGANVGEVAKLFLSRGSRVIAFEPHPDAFSKLCMLKTKRRSQFEPVNKAVGLSNENVKLYFHENHAIDSVKYSTGSSLMANKPNVSSNYILCESIDFPKYLSNFKSIKILKIDIEGYEVELIPELIRQKALDNVDNIFVETHEKKWPELKGKTEKMKTLASSSSYREKIRWDWP